jgi:glutamyl-tRNA synthetase
MDINLDELVKKYILINATEHGGRAVEKSVLGKLLADHPELRDNLLEVRSKIEFATADINGWDLKKQKDELEKLGGYEPVIREEKKGLPELEVERSFVMRFAPNPDGALHLGNARPAVLCHEYVKKYNGELILRFDDTDPKIKTPEKKFYKWIKEDLRWLKIKWDKEIIASKRLKIYYKYAEELVRLGEAYVCTCDEEWKKLRDQGKPCPCRGINKETQLRRWRKMLKHGFKEGQAVLRVKTDLEAKNPAVRDWPGFRIVDKPRHPFSKKKVWPLYNFASAIDDHLCKVTHIMRGQEHATNETKQRFLYQHFKWKYPFTIILGRFSLTNAILSKSRIREDIAKGECDGWDDPRLGTLRTLRRRGFQPEALRKIIMDVGPKPSDITISMENLSAYNRKIIDRMANRYFFIIDPKRIEIKNLPIRKIKIPLHPDVDRGFREFSLSKMFYIDSKDFDNYKDLEVRLKGLCNIKLGDVSKYTGTELKSIPKLQWVPFRYINVRIILPGKIIEGYGEITLRKAKIGDLAQFERFGFVRIEQLGKKNVTVIFTHE